MSSLNKSKRITTRRTTTYEGGAAKSFTPTQELERAVMSCFLWEDSFYESGENIADRIINLVQKIQSIREITNIGIKAKDSGIRHAPLLIAVALVKKYRGMEYSNQEANKPLIRQYIYDVIRRADELSEMLALWKKVNGDNLKPIPRILKEGVALAFGKFNAYQFAKYKGNAKEISLRDVMFLTHPTPSEDRTMLYRQIANNKLKSPDTWEVSLSAGNDKRETFERLMKEKKLGALAFLRNLRNMYAAGVKRSLINQYGMSLKFDKVFPFRFVAAWKAIKEFTGRTPPFLYKINETFSEIGIEGATLFFIDVSGSMEQSLSKRSDMERIDAACALGAIGAEIFENCDVVSFSHTYKHVMLGRDIYDNIKEISNSQHHVSTELWESLREWLETSGREYVRLIIITDEQVSDNYRDNPIMNLPSMTYIINVGTYSRGIKYPGNSRVVRINGFSEAIIKYIIEYEKAMKLDVKMCYNK